MKNFKSLFAMLLVLALCVCMMAGCSSTKEEPAASAPEKAEEVAAAPAAEPEKIKIGLIWQSLSNEYIVNWQSVLLPYIEAYYPDVELIDLDGASDAALQVTQMESLISMGVDCIILQPVDADVLVPATKAAIEAGIPVVTAGSELSEDVGQTFVGPDQKYSGTLVAEKTVELMGDTGNVAYMRGPIGQRAEVVRGEGCDEVWVNYPGIEVVFDQTGNWGRDEGMQLMENWLQTGTQIDIVVAQNDEMALGAITALKGRNMLDDVLVLGIDGIQDALISVKNGELDGTAYQHVIRISEQSFDAAYKIAKGETVEDILIVDGFEWVSPENVDEYFALVDFINNPTYGTGTGMHYDEIKNG